MVVSVVCISIGTRECDICTNLEDTEWCRGDEGAVYAGLCVSVGQTQCSNSKHNNSCEMGSRSFLPRPATNGP